MSDLKELYQQVILDHNKNPQNYHKIENATHKAEGYNPLCGDQCIVYLNVEDNIIREVSFQGKGCAISISSASIMTELLKDKSIEEANEMISDFKNMLKSEDDHTEPGTRLGKAVVLAGVRAFPARLKCATLAWHSVHSALKKKEKATTE